MGGCFQHEQFFTLEALVDYIKEQIKAANKSGLYLLQGEIKQKPTHLEGFEWIAYFSK